MVSHFAARDARRTAARARAGATQHRWTDRSVPMPRAGIAWPRSRDAAFRQPATRWVTEPPQSVPRPRVGARV